VLTLDPPLRAVASSRRGVVFFAITPALSRRTGIFMMRSFEGTWPRAELWPRPRSRPFPYDVCAHPGHGRTRFFHPHQCFDDHGSTSMVSPMLV